MQLSPIMASTIRGTFLKSIGSAYRVQDELKANRDPTPVAVREISNLTLVFLANLILLPLTRKFNIPDFLAWVTAYNMSESTSRKVANNLDIMA